ncbi:MAG TPA: hypothetical protein VK656_03035, partial [Candidatus Acidoferrum sp.]|nr:hypothetical protein [Candidatus Acidoferrum sp.]
DGPWVQRLDREVARLRTGGTRIVTITLDDASLATFGMDTMDTSRAGPAFAAGRAVGIRAAGGLADEVAGRST